MEQSIYAACDSAASAHQKSLKTVPSSLSCEPMESVQQRYYLHDRLQKQSLHGSIIASDHVVVLVCTMKLASLCVSWAIHNASSLLHEVLLYS